MWRTCYDFMLKHPGFGRRAMWWFLRRSRILDRFDDEGYLKIKLLGKTGERFAAAEDGGGINSLIVAQMLYWNSDLPRRCSDKVAVRGFVRERGLGDILVPLVPGGGDVVARRGHSMGSAARPVRPQVQQRFRAPLHRARQVRR